MFLKISKHPKILASSIMQNLHRKDFEASNASGIHPSWVILIASIWMATLGNLALWQELIRLPEMNDLAGSLVWLVFCALIFALICIVIELVVLALDFKASYRNVFNH